MVVPMVRPDVFSALASHAGDALFEACYVPEFPQVARDAARPFEGSYEVFFERLATADHIDWEQARRAAGDVRVRGRVLARPGATRARRCCRSTSRPVA